jgi:hypothetical protein
MLIFFPLGLCYQNSRISFKLFDKHPGQFPEGLRSQVSLVVCVIIAETLFFLLSKYLVGVFRWRQGFHIFMECDVKPYVHRSRHVCIEYGLTFFMVWKEIL